MENITSEFIDNLPYTKEKIVDKYIAQITKEIYKLAKEFEASGDKNPLINARCEINKKYGKYWGERLISKMIYPKNSFPRMRYFD